MRLRNRDPFNIRLAITESQEEVRLKVEEAIHDIERLKSAARLRVSRRDRVALSGLATIGGAALDAPYIFVTSLDEIHQHQLAAVGTAPSVCKVEDSLCQYTITSEAVSVFDDLQANPDIAGGALSLDGVDTYIGAPWTFQGETLGAFCALAGPDREWTSDDFRLIELCADQVTALFATGHG